MFKIGDLVTRNSYNNDIVFKIVDIIDDNYILCGSSIRLCADSYEDDLVLVEGDEKVDFSPEINEYRTLDRNEYFYLPGKVLHIDGDNDYLNKCMDFYKKNKIKAYGIFMNEDDFSDNIIELLDKYKPDILVLTGHDAYYRKKRNNSQYKNTSNFAEAVKNARKYEKSQDKLIIISGACQSNYEELIKAGSNFASSPRKINIHALDPAIVATMVAFSDKNKNIDLLKILNSTKYKSDGIGGIITNGTMYVGYPR